MLEEQNRIFKLSVNHLAAYDLNVDLCNGLASESL